MNPVGGPKRPVYINAKGVAVQCDSDMIGGGLRVPILTPMWFDHAVIDDTGWILSDGLWKNKSDAELIYTHLVEDWNDSNSVEETETISDITITFKRAADGHKIVTVANDNLDTLFEATGVAWYYVLDTVNEKFRLPKTKFGFQGIKNGGSVGKYDTPGLPNITGDIGPKSSSHRQSTGAFRSTDGGGTLTSSAGIFNYKETDFDASRSNAIYGKSDTVQPPATEMLLYFSTGVSGSGGDVINVGGGTCVPNYDVYDPDKHNVPGSTFLNRGNLYDKSIKKSDYPSLLYFTATEDSFFFPFIYTDAATAEACTAYVGESANSTNLYRVFVGDVGNSAQGYGYMIPMKKGQICACFCKNGSGSGYEYSFWLPMQSLAPQIAMPDYKATGVSVTNGWTATENGWIICSTSAATGDGSAVIFINNKIEVCRSAISGSDSTIDTSCSPISIGDVVTFATSGAGSASAVFYPCKSVPQSRPTDCVSYVVETGRFYSGTGQPAVEGQTNDSWYRLYSDGWCEMGGKKTYLASTGTNTEIVTLAKSFLDTSFTLTFGAGSSGHASDDCHVVNEDQNYRTVNTFGIQVTDPNASTKDAWNCWRAEGLVSTTPPQFPQLLNKKQ